MVSRLAPRVSPQHGSKRRQGASEIGSSTSHAVENAAVRMRHSLLESPTLGDNRSKLRVRRQAKSPQPGQGRPAMVGLASPRHPHELRLVRIVKRYVSTKRRAATSAEHGFCDVAKGSAFRAVSRERGDSERARELERLEGADGSSRLQTAVRDILPADAK